MDQRDSHSFRPGPDHPNPAVIRGEHIWFVSHGSATRMASSFATRPAMRVTGQASASMQLTILLYFLPVGQVDSNMADPKNDG